MIDASTDLFAHDQFGKIFSKGWRKASGGTVSVTEKSTGETLAISGRADAADVSAAAVAASVAQRAWAEQPSTARADVLRAFVALLGTYREQIVDWLVRESGSTRGKGYFEVDLVVRETLEAAALATEFHGRILTSTSGRSSTAIRVPIGVVGVITPWNSPFILAVRAVMPALALGNAVLLKPDIHTPFAGGLVIARLLEMAGLPDGLLHVLPGGPDTGEAVVKAPELRMISFTGSTAAGRRVGELAGQGLKRVALELGGNNALIAFEDADIDRMISAAAFGAFFHQGQICFTAGRHLVQRRIYPQYVQALKKRASLLRVGDPTDASVQIGPMINERQAQRGKDILDRTVASGAVVETGGQLKGLYFEPTVLSGVTPQMPAFSEERFAPIAVVIPFDEEEEAIGLANQTEYGLVASVFTKDLRRGQRVASRLNTGIVHINDQTVVHEVYGPIGGMGASGNGARTGNLAWIDEYTVWKWITESADVPQYPF